MTDLATAALAVCCAHGEVTDEPCAVHRAAVEAAAGPAAPVPAEPPADLMYPLPAPTVDGRLITRSLDSR